MTIAQRERTLLCEEMLRVGPLAPTLCEGWTTADLAAHLWVRETDPLAMPGMALPALAGVTQRRMDAALARCGYDGLVERLAVGPARWSVFALPGLDEAANAMEYLVHHEDVRRATDEVEPRELSPQTEDLCWSRLGPVSKLGFRRAGVAVVLEDATRPTRRLRAGVGSDVVTLIGKPSELLLYALGRQAVARVEFVGTARGVARLAAVTPRL